MPKYANDFIFIDEATQIAKQQAHIAAREMSRGEIERLKGIIYIAWKMEDFELSWDDFKSKHNL